MRRGENNSLGCVDFPEKIAMNDYLLGNYVHSSNSF